LRSHGEVVGNGKISGKMRKIRRLSRISALAACRVFPVMSGFAVPKKIFKKANDLIGPTPKGDMIAVAKSRWDLGPVF
jgi:hypothetical protein